LTLWRIRDRATFEHLRRDGRRVRRGLVSVTYLPPAAEGADHPARVAFAVPRRPLGSVGRNRVRRRLRAAVAAAAPPPGALLVSAGPGAASAPAAQLHADVRAAVAAAAEVEDEVTSGNG
jgi:RNase P protein component